MVIYSKSSVQNFNNLQFRIRKTNTLLNLINEQGVIDKIYLYAKDFSEPKCEYLVKNCEDAGINHPNNHKNHDNIRNIYKNHVVDGNVQ